jgi:hypothetical protein
MNRKMNLVLLVVFAGMMTVAGFTSCSKKDGGTGSGGSKSSAASGTPKREADGQYRIGSKVQVYDGNGKPMDDYFTYFPSELNLMYSTINNAIILNFQPGNSALFFLKSNELDSDGIGFFRNSIDKSIGWAATAKQNNVHSLRKEIPRDDGEYTTTAYYGLKTNLNRLDPVYLAFEFYIGDAFEKGKEDTWLLIQYVTRDQARARSQGRFICFREDDFARLKEMFSESSLAEIDKQEAAWQKTHAEQDTLFE